MPSPQFRLRTAVALVAIAALAFAYVSRGVADGERQSAAVAELRGRRVAVIYDWTIRNGEDLTPVVDPSGKGILRRSLGDDFFDKVAGLFNHNDNLSDADLTGLVHLHHLRFINFARSHVTDAGLDVISRMGTLVHLDVSDTPITDAGMSKLAAMKSLQYLNASNTQITRESLRTFADMPSLEGVAIRGTRISATDCDELRRTRPDLRIDL
jgi:hypothetical protein